MCLGFTLLFGALFSKTWRVHILFRDYKLKKTVSSYTFNSFICTVDPRYLDFGYLELPFISKRKSDPCYNIEI